MAPAIRTPAQQVRQVLFNSLDNNVEGGGPATTHKDAMDIFSTNVDSSLRSAKQRQLQAVFTNIPQFKEEDSGGCLVLCGLVRQGELPLSPLSHMELQSRH